MFQKQAAAFIYCISPVHMGAGSAVGVIDNPIQREKHTDHPSFAGSGIKGAVRHGFASLLPDEAKQPESFKKLVSLIFGPESNGDLHAGAVSFGDAQLVAFPIRSLRGGFVYATCPLALARLHRLLTMTSKDCKTPPDWKVPEEPKPSEGCTVINERGLLSGEGANKNLNLEVFQFTQNDSAKEALGKVADWLAKHAMPEGESYHYFRSKLNTDLVLLSNEDFSYFVRNATTVEAHVSIDEKTGTAAKGKLFYTENLPPETLMVAPLLASKTRSGSSDLEAPAVMSKITEALRTKGGLLQIGGDATVGRGHVVLRVLEG